jgi:hypothetical protein
VLTGPFCSVCGQKEVDLNPTLTSFLHEVWHELTHVDGKLIPSVRMLIISPGALTLEHYAGRRARYLSPIRLYLVFSILYFAVFAVAALTPNTNFRVTVGADNTSGWSIETRPIERRSDPEALRKLGYDTEEELRQAASGAVTRWLPRLMFLLLPVFAALTGLFVKRLEWNYPRHVHFALHLHATWFLLLTVSAAANFIPIQWIGELVSIIMAVWIVVYFILALRRTYNLTLGGAMWRAAAVGVVYGGFLIASVLFIVLSIAADKT